MNSIRKALEGECGYAKLTFAPADLEVLRSLIREQWLRRISDIAPDQVKRFEALPIDRYHELAGLIDHRAAWPKLRRILEQPAVDKIRQLPTFRKLVDEFGEFTISDEENLGRENIYWRLVRPDSPSDVGPMHADQWFWALGHGSTPDNVQRVKIWIAIYCESGKSGFRLVSGSHRQDWPYHGEFRDGFTKPVIDVRDDQLDIRMFDSEPGDAIVFHDRLLHGGAVGGDLSRVSLEFTMFVKNDRYFQ
jgi:hypothetical protein